MTKYVVPTPDEILQPGLERMYTLRPRSFDHINLRTGRYWHPFLGFRAQTADMVKRLVDRLDAHRLRTATGQDLLDFVASEYDTIPETGRTFAIGEVTLVRTTSTTAGDVRKGTKLSRAANTTTQLPLTSAEYELLVDVHFEIGQTTAGPVPIRAVNDGAAANHPITTVSVPHGVSPPGGILFDRTITVGSFSAAGGADGTDDPYLRRFAKAFSIGQYGPTQSEALYGALRATGVRYILGYDVQTEGKLKVLVADSSWSSSDRWAATVEQALYDADLVGFGCVVETDVVRNKVVSIEATVALRDITYARETTQIDLAIRKATKDYFDNRPDWNVWKKNSLMGVISRCHPKIYNCTDLVMKDTTGTVVPEISTPDYTAEQFHYYLSNGAVTATYTGPV